MTRDTIILLFYFVKLKCVEWGVKLYSLSEKQRGNLSIILLYCTVFDRQLVTATSWRNKTTSGLLDHWPVWCITSSYTL